MARYIDADSLRDRVKIHTNPYGKPTIEYASGLKVLIMIDQEPTADVAEVVRCKDCIHSKKYNYLEPEGRCMCERKFVRHGIYKKPAMLEVSKDDFCSWGERKDNNHD